MLKYGFGMSWQNILLFSNPLLLQQDELFFKPRSLSMMWLLALLLSVSLATLNAQDVTTTNGTSGPLCGKHRCISPDGICEDNKKCVCQGPKSVGLGNFVCVRPNERFCALFNDPRIKGFDGSHIDVPLGGKFFTSHIETKACKSRNPDSISTRAGLCDFRMFAWGGRRLGKTFLKGIEVRILVTVGDGIYHHRTRIYTEAYNSLYFFTEDGNKEPFGGMFLGAPVVTNVPGFGTISSVYDSVNNFARIVAEPCGIEVGLRGVEHVLDPLLMPSGAYIKVYEECDPQYLSTEHTLCSPPIGKGLSLEDYAEELAFLAGKPVSLEIAAMYKVLTSDTVQDFPNAPSNLQILTDTTQECDASLLIPALEQCLFILKTPLFFNCFDTTDNGDEAVMLLAECIFSVCDGNRRICREVKAMIMNSGCQSYAPTDGNILSHDCKFR